ncbi:MAG: Glutamate N-acetyltransferase (EC / N-acetylglutamate synthase (EC [uncultured Campylobacterales bacterium]|uniref:Arginine biosynthesis bifunctional protein ArgJ n=1 Tax=uncultured Campylobacterales bacterium TaxID=352960 RepID=A0A6S6RYA7_9BACT|nr:MAG: Glutamate N-acetyltransferase (EC / N-acetylglutamate synthase (EC [uncultured Campylobacterales bacterium]
MNNFDILSLEGGLNNIQGIYTNGVNVGMKTTKANGSTIKDEFDPDVMFLRSDEPMQISAIFTTNKFQAAPIQHFQEYPKNFKTNFLLANSKNANAMTLDEGLADIKDIFKELSNHIDITNPIMSSTGVIGQRLDIDKITSAFTKFDFNSKNSNASAQAIMTTDTFKKELCFKVELTDGSYFHIAGIAKGAGMIEPSMATMLSFLVTDADIPKSDMAELLATVSDSSFNAISVDGDTSTNDTLMLLSTNKQAYDKEAFEIALKMICERFAFDMLRDGEGSTKVVAFEVTGAKDDNQARIAAKALSNSLLVKTALFGEDPNWGRIASTIGASGIECDPKKLVIKYDDLTIYSRQNPQMSQDTEDKAYKIMKNPEFKISCDIGIDDGKFTAYGCDLSYEYVKINAEYRS